MTQVLSTTPCDYREVGADNGGLWHLERPDNEWVAFCGVVLTEVEPAEWNGEGDDMCATCFTMGLATYA